MIVPEAMGVCSYKLVIHTKTNIATGMQYNVKYIDHQGIYKGTQTPRSSSQRLNTVLIDRRARPASCRPKDSKLCVLLHWSETAPNRSQVAVNAKLTPNIPIPMNAKAVHRFRLWVRLKLSEKSCRATLAMMPAVIANMHP